MIFTAGSAPQSGLLLQLSLAAQLLQRRLVLGAFVQRLGHNAKRECSGEGDNSGHCS